MRLEEETEGRHGKVRIKGEEAAMAKLGGWKEPKGGHMVVAGREK